MSSSASLETEKDLSPTNLLKKKIRRNESKSKEACCNGATFRGANQIDDSAKRNGVMVIGMVAVVVLIVVKKAILQPNILTMLQKRRQLQRYN